MAAVLEILIKAIDQASPALSGLAQKAGSIGPAFQKLGSAVQGSVIPIGLAVVATDKLTSAALEDEASIVRLQQAVKAANLNWGRYGAALEDTAKKGLQLGFADEKVRASLALLIASTGDADEAMRRLAIAQDVSRGTGLELETTTRLVAKVTDESIQVFSRYGIRLDETMGAQEALAAVQQRFAGQAEAYGASNAGAMERTRLKMGELQEQVGRGLMPILMRVIEVFSALPEPMQVALIGLMAFGPAIAALIPIVQALGAAFLTPPIGFIVILVAAGVAVYVFRDQIIGAFVFIKDQVVGAITALGAFLADKWREIVTVALAILFPPGAGLFALVTNSFGVRDRVIEAFSEIISWFRSAWGNITEAIVSPLRPVLSFITRIIRKVEDLLDLLGKMPGAGGSIPVISGIFPGLQHGGIITRPIVRLLGEAGPEAVIPLDKAGAMGVTVVNHFHGDVYGVLDLDRHILQTVYDAFRGGGFRGVQSKV